MALQENLYTLQLARAIQLVADKAGISLDLGCGAVKQPGFVGLDIRDLPGVDIVWDMNVHPWPLPDVCCRLVLASHIVEHIPPSAFVDGATRFLFIEWMNEVWRIMKPGGELAISTPHGYSMGYLQDPTHCNPCNEHTWYYFQPGNNLYNIYRPKPWKLKLLAWSPAANLEVALTKLETDEPIELQVSYG